MKKVETIAQSKSYQIGYRRPPKNHQFTKGQSGNPSGGRRKPKAPNLKAQLENELNKTVKVRSGRRLKQLSKAAAGIEQLVDQFAAGNRNARRDLIALCEKLGVPLMNRDALENALTEALSAEDEAALADFVDRHGGRYPARTDAIFGDPDPSAHQTPPTMTAGLPSATRNS
jgi:uncharacterized protein DUF5681